MLAIDFDWWLLKKNYWLEVGLEPSTDFCEDAYAENTN